MHLVFSLAFLSEFFLMFLLRTDCFDSSSYAALICDYCALERREQLNCYERRFMLSFEHAC